MRKAKTEIRAVLTIGHSTRTWTEFLALLRAHGVAPPRIHDMSAVLEAEREKLPREVQPHVERLAAISKDLRRDRELAFDGTEDLTPSSFYAKTDAERARDAATFTVRTVEPAVLGND